ncbi:MAG: 5-dehydro-2-deoxygluconokinase [Salinibacter sp.]
MTVAEAQYDVLTMGRSSIDLYSNDIGTPFPEIESFGAFVGGCPTNISVGTRRLGLRSALLTAVGEDPVGDFIERFLDDEGVETGYIPRKPGYLTSAVVLGIEPPDKFPIVFYRDNCADLQLDIDDVLKSPIADSRALLITGTGLSHEPSRSATLFAAERARATGRTVFFDLDFRADQWDDPRAFGVWARALLPCVDVVMGTEEEVKVAALSNALEISIAHSQITSPEIGGDLDAAVDRLIERAATTLVLKRGTDGASVYPSEGDVVHAAPFPVEVVNVLGAGDAFASGLIYGVLNDWDWERAARMGNACGAIVVTRQGCANFMAYEREALDLIEANGGLG